MIDTGGARTVSNGFWDNIRDGGFVDSQEIVAGMPLL